ncbi:MAG: transposase [Anaerolineae bacterium]|nr:transposase [Anaerolineae bacterium]
MVRIHYFRARIARVLADALNAESGRAYTDALVRHWRVYRRHRHWLSRKAASKLQDAEFGPAALLHSHSLDAAREGFYNACKTARTCRKQGLDNKYPFRCKRFRPTTWKNTAIRKDGEALLLSLARGNEPIRVRLPAGLCSLPADAFREVKLVYNRSGWYEWHVAVEDGREPQDAPGNRVIAVDPGEIHPLCLTDGEETLIVTARELRAVKHWRNKKLAEIQHKQAAKVKGSRAWWRLQRAKNRLLAKTRRQQRDTEHKVSRAAAEWVRECEAGTVVYGDVRDVGDGKRLHRQSQQKVSQWTHGKVRAYFTYKVEEFGIEVELQDEAYTTRSCPGCKHKHKPRGRVYACPVCGLRAHRDAVGAANILSLYLQGEMGHIQPTAPKYRQPFRKACSERSRRERPRRSPEDTGQVAVAGRHLPRCQSVEAPH